eukprot:CAMPEP_0170555132 /NCGR_PEP_ID=MMETSP0211-20121228/13017_1 /TAXON_ID=311385 /ORGANISM="Pseudokeronopsis sp., Strain OXSARD2" /LENGTH=58 /DNA_ID=CAMNT_0010864743 /DNA_START=421 /DNA_END=597 /DNA_ORIENTATION=-
MYNLIDAEVGFLASIYCMIVIIIGSFFLLNLILAVIIQGFISQQKDKLQDVVKQIEKK